LNLAEARRRRALEAGRYDDILEAPEVINIKAIFRSDQKGYRSHFRQLKQWSGSPSEVPPNVSLTARARVGTLKADVVFDTGAQVTTMSVSFYKRLGCPPLLNVLASASGADGTGLRLIGAVKMELTLGVRKFAFRAWVIEGLRTDVLVGLDFMRQFPTTVDVAEAKEILSSDTYAQEVREIEGFYQRAGIHSVPAVIINDKHLISGGQPAEVFEQALRRIASGEV
jgi:hypothetical protein